MTFHVGQKVVCVYSGVWDDTVTGEEFIPGINAPKWGEVCACLGYDPNDPDSIFLAEFEDSWEAICFRPIVETETDISIFTAMLNKVPQLTS